MADTSRGPVRAAAALGVGLVLALAIGEGLLRLVGRAPAPRVPHANEPVMLEEDPVRGWRNRPGAYVYPGYVRGAPDVRVTIWPDGTRATGPARVERPDAVVVAGCSFTFGWSLTDGRTLAWKLQEAMPEVRIENRGTAAYGTLQALMSLEEMYAGGARPRLVVYDFLELHALRNVAAAEWLRGVSATRGRNHVRVPYATRDEGGRLVRHAPEAVPTVPLRNRLALAALVEDALIAWRARGRADERRAVTEALVVAMRDLVRAHGSRFLVAWLAHIPEDEASYLPRLKAAGIDVADCRDPEFATLRTAGEGHPNGEMNTRWAECLSRAVRAELAR